MRALPTVEALRGFWTDSLSPKYQQSKAVLAEKDRLKVTLPRSEHLAEVVKQIEDHTDRKRLQKFWMSLDGKWTKHRDVRRAIKKKLEMIKAQS